jgi:tRNA(Ile)-lysidine synthase
MQFDFVYRVYQIYTQNYSDKNKLIAVSFGQDSITLVFILFYINQVLKQSIHLLHCNHFYKANNLYILREGFKISYLVNSNLIISCPINNLQTETKQRLWRHRIFKRILNLVNLNSIYLGHTKTDKVETFLFNLFRGSNLTNLSNFNYQNIYSEHECFKNSPNKLIIKINPISKIEICRPLFNSSRQTIKNIINSNKIPNLIDYSNFDTKFSRNKVRLLLVPILKIYFNKNIETQIERALTQAEIDNVYFTNKIATLLLYKDQITKSNFKKLPKAEQYRFLKQLLTCYSGKDVNFNLIKKLETKI